MGCLEWDAYFVITDIQVVVVRAESNSCHPVCLCFGRRQFATLTSAVCASTLDHFTCLGTVPPKGLSFQLDCPWKLAGPIPSRISNVRSDDPEVNDNFETRHHTSVAIGIVYWSSCGTPKLSDELEVVSQQIIRPLPCTPFFSAQIVML